MCPADHLADLPGVRSAERHGESVTLSCQDSDQAIRALLERYPAARDIEITGAGLEDAFLELTVRRRTTGRAMNGLLYTRFELLRAFRQRRFLLFSLGFPLILFFVIAGPNRNVHNFEGTGISLPLYYMAGLVSFGTMVSMISTGGRIADERQVGWTRQLRVSPLPTRAYFRAKVITAYALAALSIAALYAAGAVLGVSLSAGDWLAMTGLILVGLMPFAALGILLGHLVTVDAIGPVGRAGRRSSP